MSHSLFTEVLGIVPGTDRCSTQDASRTIILAKTVKSELRKC